MEAIGVAFYSNIKSRGRPNDPPDCEGVDQHGDRVAIEVTEIVNGQSIRAFMKRRVYEWADWNREQFLCAVTDRIAVKEKRY
jgi:hypothetical protein